MQAILGVAATVPCTRTETLPPWRCPKPRKSIAFHRTRATPANDTSTVDYSSMTSVFPAEACETVGGEACAADMYPEVKLKPESSKARKVATEEVDREYVEYNEPKTVFPDEACDDLGGEFCEPEYQKGVSGSK